jgi:hypothetical protein
VVDRAEQPDPVGPPATPADAATGGVISPAAEAPPTVRDRRGSIAAGLLMLFAAALVLLVTALIASGERTAGVSAIAGIGLLALAVLGLFSLRLAALIALPAGIALAASGILVEPLQAPEWSRLAAGAIIFMAGTGILATKGNPSARAEEPEPGIEAGA